MEHEPQIKLSLEQEFQIRAFEEQITNISLEAYVKHFIRQSLLNDFLGD
jgi:hypothetical protein